MAKLMKITLAFFTLFVVTSGQEDVLAPLADVEDKDCDCIAINIFKKHANTCQDKCRNMTGESEILFSFGDDHCIEATSFGLESIKCILDLIQNNPDLKAFAYNCPFPELDANISSTFDDFAHCYAVNLYKKCMTMRE